MNKATLIKVDGTELPFGRRPSLFEAQQEVEGYVELVKARGPEGIVTLVVNEDGKPLNLPTNKVVTERYGKSIYNGYIVGNVIVLKGWRTVG